MPGAATTATLKDAAVTFLQLAAAGHVKEAYDRFVAPSFRHHNPYFKGDAASLAAGMAQNAAEFPHKVLEVKRVVAEGELVAVFSRVRMTPGGQDIALFHLFRFAEGRVMELWDMGQPVPADSPNENGMF